MRVEARDTGKGWQTGAVTCVAPLRVKLDNELSGCGWDEVRILDEDRVKAGPAILADIKQKILEDAKALVQEAKDAALTELKAAVGGVRLLAELGSPTPEAIKEAKARVAAAIKSATEKGVSKEELIEASSAMGKAKEAEAKVAADAIEAKKTKKQKEKDAKKAKEAAAMVEFENPELGTAVREAAEKAKEEGKTLPEIIKAALEAAKAIEGASPEDMKKVKKAAAGIAMKGSSSSSSDSDDEDGNESEDTEQEESIGAAAAAKAKREGIAAVFYFDAMNSAPPVASAPPAADAPPAAADAPPAETPAASA